MMLISNSVYINNNPVYIKSHKETLIFNTETSPKQQNYRKELL